MRPVAIAAAVVVVAGVAGTLFVCKKKPPPAPAAQNNTAKVEARVDELAESVRSLEDANLALTLRVDSLESVQSQLQARSRPRRRSDSGEGGGGAARAAASSDSIAIDLDRQKLIFTNYKTLQREGFQGDTIPTYLSRKYGLDTSTVEAIARRGQQEGW
jgi:hypothetical protein